jgi:hypothetical protein
MTGAGESHGFQACRRQSMLPPQVQQITQGFLTLGGTEPAPAAFYAKRADPHNRRQAFAHA